MCFRDLELYRGVMERHGDSGKPAIITEFGALEETPADLGQYSWMKLPSLMRAQYLVQALRMARTQYTWLMGANIFNLDYAAAKMPSGSERPWFSLLNADKTPRAAYLWIQAARSSGYLPA